MKLVLVMTPIKSVVNIDPLTKQEDRRFNPRVSVVVFHLGEEQGDTGPKVVNGYAGQLTTLDAGLLSEALNTASFMASRVEAGESLEAVFNTMKSANKSCLEHTLSSYNQQFQIH